MTATAPHGNLVIGGWKFFMKHVGRSNVKPSPLISAAARLLPKPETPASFKTVFSKFLREAKFAEKSRE